MSDLIISDDPQPEKEPAYFSFPEPGYHEPGGRWNIYSLPWMPPGLKFWRCQGGKWRPVDLLVIRREFPGDADEFDAFVKSIKYRNYLPPSFAAPPFYLPDKRLFDEADEPLPIPKVIRNIDGDFDLTTLKLLPHDPKYLATSVVPVRLNPNARAPVFSQFIQQLVPCDGQRRFLLEFLGLCLVPEFNEFKKLLCIVGPKDCGKSKLMHVFENVIGKTNCSHLSNKALASPFGLFNTLGKPVNISAEENWPTRGECYIIKAISGGDVLPAEIKHGPVLSIRPTIRLINISNDQVHYPDPNMWGRVSIINCCDSIPRELQDFRLEEKLLAELEGVFLILLSSVINLYKRGDFEDVPSMRENLDDAQRYSNHLIEFCESCFEAEPDNLQIEIDITEAYTSFCKDGNYRATASIDIIREELQTRYGLDKNRHRQRVDGERLPAIKGIRLVRYRGKKGSMLEYEMAAARNAREAEKERREAEKIARSARETAKHLEQQLTATARNAQAAAQGRRGAERAEKLTSEAAKDFRKTKRAIKADERAAKEGDDSELDEIVRKLGGDFDDDDVLELE